MPPAPRGQGRKRRPPLHQSGGQRPRRSSAERGARPGRRHHRDPPPGLPPRRQRQRQDGREISLKNCSVVDLLLSARMFLMNASPLVALQTKWESFGPARNCRYPVCYPEPEEEVSRTSVSAKVQMIINNLQSQESALGMNNEYDCIMQKKQQGEKGSSNRVTSSPVLLQKHPQYTQCGSPADSDDTEEEEGVGFGRLLLDSDSDDSVDRGIEEAIQEYLKAKTQSDQSLQRGAECSENISRDKRFKREFSQNKVASNLLPVKFKAEMLSEEYLSDHLGIGKRLQPASPQSISSDDSFEQSIQAEIVQFLNEKKQQEIHKCVTGEEKDSHVRSALKCSKEATNKPNCGAIKQGCSALLLRHRAELQKPSTQAKGLQSKTQPEPSDFSQVNPAYLEMATASQPWAVEQGEESGANYWESRGALVSESVHISDSSSDDGIEEAIQLYQLEKIRREAGHATDCVPLQREGLPTKGLADISASLTISSTTSASPEIHKSPISNKRKETDSTSTELESTSNDFNKLLKPLKKARHFALPENKIAACELTLQASCRADTSAELMCAEAILDISKTIMPSQMGSDSKSLAADSFSPQLLSSSCCDSDSSLVDSDDSIEQEIRAFLALKAQSENLGTKPPSLSHSLQIPLPSDQNSLASTLEPPLPKSLKLSLNRKKRLKREGRIAKQGASKPPEQVETGLFQPGSYPKLAVLQEERAPSSPTELCDAQRLGSKEPRQQQLPAPKLSGSDGKCVALDSVNPFMQVQSSTRKPVKNSIQTPERDGSDDESSSLDSDEDLDSAIKDLLRSKRKLKKKSKEQKSQCKKRVRFSETEAQLLDGFSNLQQGRNPVVLKSCLSKPRKAAKENPARNPPDNTGVKPPSEKPETGKNLDSNLQLRKGSKPRPVTSQNNLQAAKNRQCTFTAPAGADDSSSVDSDDSIEQEIRKFLAEKAKDSASTSELQKDDAALDLLRVTKQTAPKGKAKPQLVESELDLVLGRSDKPEVSQHTEELKNSPGTEGKGAMLHGSGKCASSAQNVHTTGQSKAKQGLVGVKGAAAGEVSGSTAGKKDVPNPEPVQKTLPPKTSKNGGGKVRKVVTAKPRSKRKNTFHLKISSKFIAGLKGARDRKKSMLLNKRQKTESLLAQSSALGTEAASQDADVLNQGRGAPSPKDEFSGESPTAIKGSSSQKLTGEGSSPHVAETCGRLEAAPLPVREEAGGWERAGAAAEQSDSHSNLPLQEQSVAAVKVDKVCRGTSKAGSAQMWIEAGDTHKDSWADPSVDAPRPQHSVAVVQADKVSRDASQQGIHVCSKGGNNQQDKSPAPSLGCPPQELNVTAVAVDKTGGEACTDNSTQMCNEEGKAVRHDSDRQEEMQVSSSSLEGKVPVLENRETTCEVDQGQEVVDKPCAKGPELPAGICPDSLSLGGVSHLRRKGRCKKLKVLSTLIE
ncbi:protein phosphatase 1 regulatory subunit 26 [Pezoporus wallicus]|uniref:protein phosphatase 1 regulatory subunit 26 n=1 Tax=Pezoporus wallicus TaxID=35540 RepID=UPI002550FEB6|nr:protein phosphatase 1 regulatory subunit 26 [Pezoporus wallicus]